MSKQSRQLILLLILVTAGIFYGYYVYIFTPKWADIQVLKQYRQEGQSRYEGLLAYREEGRSLYEELFELETKLDKLREQIPHQIDKPQLIIDLYTVAKINQVQPQEVTFEELQTMDTYVTQALTFTCLGTQESIIQMIDDLQTENNQGFTLESLNFTNNEGILTGEIRLITYASKVGEGI